MKVKIKEVSVRPADMRGHRGLPKTKLYILIDGETLWQNLENRRQRPYTFYRTLIPEIMKQAGIIKTNLGYSDLKFKWSQYAGCKCGCSPGFVAAHYRGYEIYATICEEEA